MSSTIYVTAELKIKPNIDRVAATRAIEQFCIDMESEPGCLQATVSYDLDDERRVILWERYESQEAIEAHFAMPHTQAFIQLGITELVRATSSRKQEMNQ